MKLTKFNLGFIQGQWEAFDRILALLNTLDTRQIDKHTLYGQIMQMRPVDAPEGH